MSVNVALCECCGEAPATEWHPDQNGEVWPYCAPCVAALLAEQEERDCLDDVA